MRLASRFLSRSGYAMVAGSSAALVTSAFLAVIGGLGLGTVWFVAGVGVVPTIAALLLWPRGSHRTGRQMLGRGILIGLLVHVALSLAMAVGSRDPEMFFGMMGLSIIFTLGIPILLAGALSWLFRSPSGMP